MTPSALPLSFPLQREFISRLRDIGNETLPLITPNNSAASPRLEKWIPADAGTTILLTGGIS